MSQQDVLCYHDLINNDLKRIYMLIIDVYHFTYGVYLGRKMNVSYDFYRAWVKSWDESIQSVIVAMPMQNFHYN